MLSLQRTAGNRAVARVLASTSGVLLQREIDAVRSRGDLPRDQVRIGQVPAEEIEQLRKRLEPLRWKLAASTEGHCYTAVQGSVDTEGGGKKVTWVTKTLFYDPEEAWLDLLHEQDHIRQYEALVRERLGGKNSWEVEEWDQEYLDAHPLTEWTDTKADVANKGYGGQGENPLWAGQEGNVEYAAVNKAMIRGPHNDVLELHAYAREYLRLAAMHAPSATLETIEAKAEEHRPKAVGLIGEPDDTTVDEVVAACNAVQPFAELLPQYDAARKSAG